MIFCFFFQAEDGIRDKLVTGVQTCALPIYKAIEVNADAIGLSALLVSTSKQMPICVQELDKRGMSIPVLIGGAARSEERRVGKECRSLWSTHHKKNKHRTKDHVNHETTVNS